MNSSNIIDLEDETFNIKLSSDESYKIQNEFIEKLFLKYSGLYIHKLLFIKKLFFFLDIESEEYSNKIKILFQILELSRESHEKVVIISKSIPTLGFFFLYKIIGLINI